MELYGVENFGSTDADYDGYFLADCFQDHDAYKDAINHRRNVIIGRKGSGKTAIFQKLRSIDEPTVFCYGHAFEDYPWGHHEMQAEQGVPENQRYIQSWKYLVWLTLGTIILKDDHGALRDEASADAIRKVESFIVDSYGSSKPDLTQLFTPDKQIKIKGGLKAFFGSVDFERIKISELPRHFQEVNKKVGSAVIDALHPEHDYYICFDELDLSFDKSVNYQDKIVGLLLAARQINLAAKRANKRLSVIVFLRDDIYDSLQFEDKNKITQVNVSRIQWKPTGNDLTLQHLMEKRFQKALNRNGENRPIEWQDIFDETQEMPSRQTKYDHICDRTFWRPRDMIHFCNQVLDAYKSRVHGLAKFQNSEVHNARSRHSEYLVEELDDEISKHVSPYKEYLEVIKSIGKTQFTPKQFEEAWSRRPSLEEVPYQEALVELFTFSVIGYFRQGGGGGGSKYIWKYKDNSAKFDPGAEKLRVHPGFKEALDLSQGNA